MPSTQPGNMVELKSSDRDGKGAASRGQDMNAQRKIASKQQAALFRHDIFNLVALAIVNSLNCWYLLYGKEFETFWWVSMAYFLLDFAWILLDPACVKSPAVLLIHHIVAVLYMMLPFNYPATAPKMSYVMTVEVNTWLLIARRVMPSRLLDVLFYATWVLIRNIFFPYLIWDVSKVYWDVVREDGAIFHPILFAPVMQVALTGLNFQWSYELFKKAMRPKKDAGKSHLL